MKSNLTIEAAEARAQRAYIRTKKRPQIRLPVQ